jgi:glycosyltransferase involved in cell wall biosynthesis
VRVLHVIKGMGPGGAERLLVSLTRARSDDLEVHVAYLLPHKDQLVGPLEAAGGTAHLLAGPRGFGDPRWPLRLRRLVRRLRPAVVHVHSPAVAAITRPLVRALPGRPVLVSTEHNEWGSFGLLTRAANAATLALDDVRLAVSEEVRASSSVRSRAHTEVLVHGVPLTDIEGRRSERDDARAELGLAAGEVLVAHVANLREKKDHATLLAAAAAALEAEPRLRFVSVGQGPLAADVGRLHAELGIGDRFDLAGYHDDPVRVLAAADVFTLTSRHEGLPISLLEAMAVGLPSVVSAVGGIPSVVRHDVEALLVAPGDVAGFRDAYVALARDQARRRRLADAAVKRAAAFDIGRAAARLEERYAAACADRSR